MAAELDALVALLPFAGQLGLVLDEASADRVIARLAWAPHLCTTGGVMHGGVLMSLADTAGAWSRCSPSTVTATRPGRAAADAAASAGIVSPPSPAANPLASPTPGRCSRQPGQAPVVIILGHSSSPAPRPPG